MDEKEKNVSSSKDSVSDISSSETNKNSQQKIEDDEEITFATVDTKRSSVNRIPTASNSLSDGVVFASSDGKVKNSSAEHSKQKRKAPIVTAVVSAAAIVCIAAATAIIISSNNNTAVTTAAQPSNTETENSESQNSKKDVASAEEVAQISIAEASYNLSGANKTNIEFGKNVTVEGINLSGKTLSQSFDAMQDKLKELREEITITANSGGKTCVLTQDDFSFDSNLSDVLIQAYHFSRGELQTPTVETVSNGNTTDFKISTAINSNSIDNAVKKAAKEFDVPPVNAHVKKFDPNAKEKFTYADGSNGFLVDQNELKNDIKQILAQDEKVGSFSIEAKEAKYKISLADVKANTKLIASHRTTAANVYASNENMKLAIRAASGTEVKPGEIFSFNEMTGDTTNGSEHTYPNGVTGSYVPSTAIVSGRYEQQYGGGICQASTTLYNCALKADMEPVERHAHQFPSSYADYGLDATVDYGNLDMKFKNTKEYSVFIATYIYDSNGDGLDELNVEMYGPISTEYDEIVPVGWVYYAGDYGYGAKGAKVYFKNGKEVKRVLLPAGDYDYQYDSYSSALSMIPGDPDNGPSVSPTGTEPTIYSPNGCGSCAPIKYGTAAAVLSGAMTSGGTGPTTNGSNNNNKQEESSKPVVTVTTQNGESSSSSDSKPEESDDSSDSENSKTESSDE